MEEFLSLNGLDAEGRYEHKDWELAERFGATIPSIQYMRRKLRKVREILGPRAGTGRVVEYLLRAESVLSRGKGAVEELAASEKQRVPAARKPAAKKAAAKKPAAKKPAAKKPAAAKKTAAPKKKKPAAE